MSGRQIPAVCHIAPSVASEALCGMPGHRIDRFIMLSDVKPGIGLLAIRNPCPACVKAFNEINP